MSKQRYLRWGVIGCGDSCPIALFPTRREAREFVAAGVAFLRTRADLQHDGWKMPRVIRVRVTVEAA